MCDLCQIKVHVGKVFPQHLKRNWTTITAHWKGDKLTHRKKRWWEQFPNAEDYRTEIRERAKKQSNDVKTCNATRHELNSYLPNICAPEKSFDTPDFLPLVIPIRD